MAYYYISLIGENADLLKEANFGRCPHKVFLLNLKFKDKDTGEILKGIDYKITDQDGNSKSFNSADYPKIWRRAGNYTISASLEGYKDYTKDYSIEYRPEHKGSLLNIVYEDFDLYINDSQTNDVTIYMESIKHNVTVNVVSEDGKPIDKPAIKCSYNTSGIINNIIKSATNAVNFFRITNPQEKAENSFEFSLPKGTHTFTVSKAGFETVNVPVNVDKNDEEITVVLQVKKINLSVAVIDADGLPIESPTIIIQGNQCEYTPKQSIDGEYTYELPIGTYMLSVSKEGYMSETGDEIAQQEITVGLIENDYVTVKLIPGLKDWQKAYADYLKEQYKTKSYLKFSTAYINDDDIPELITAESDMRVATASVYTFYDGEVKLCGSGGESGILTYKEKQNMFMSYYGIMGNLSWKLFSIVDGEAQQAISFSESSNTGKYFVNDQEVSESEYEKYYNEYDLENKNNTWNVIKYSSSMVKPTDENIEKYIYEVVSGYSNNSYSTNSEYLSSEVLQESSDAAYSDSESYLPDTIYNFYVLHDNSAGLKLSNIVYFNQYHTDVNGRMDIPYQLNGMTEGKDYFLIHYGYIPKNNSIIDETDTFGDDFECKMAVNDVIYFDTENNDLTFTAYDPEIISVDKDGVCTALSAGTTKLTIVQNDIKTYNIEIIVENEASPGDNNDDENIGISDERMGTLSIGTVTIGLDDLKNAGYQVTVPLSISNNPGFKEISFGVSYDERLTLSKAKEAGIMALAENGITKGVVNNDLNKIYLGGAVVNSSWLTGETVYIEEDGEIWNFIFTVPEDAEPGDVYTIKMLSEFGGQSSEISCADGTGLPLLEDGAIVIAETYTATTTQPATTTEPITTTTTNYTSATSTTITETNTTSVSTTPTSSTETRPVDETTEKGDINNDGNIDIADATMVLMMYAYSAAGMDISGYTEEQLSAADIDGDGKISISDAAYILTYYAQNAAGMNPSWEDILKK